MIAEIGHFALILALTVAVLQGTVPLAGGLRGDVRLMALARPAVVVQALCVAVSFAALMHAFITDDFSVRYVTEHSNALLPMLYKVAGVWGGHEGSLLLWVLMLAFWSLAVATFSRRLPARQVALVLSVLGLVAVGFHAFLLFASNPFQRLMPPAQDGRDLNPLLQDPGMAFHPPMLYMGYVGFSVAFAFAIAALISGRLDAAWARWSRPWTTTAWIFLTLGIALGSYWAYYELGWGGWWFWDPVENASFMPWLVGTALIHSLAVTEKRGSFKNWTVLLAIAAFSLSLLGTFLVRSGVLTSVHAFATDPRRGIFVLAFLVAVVGSSLTLFAWRAPKVSPGGSFALLSRETFLLVNNVLLVVAAGSVLLGTLYPLLLDALGLGKISVGPPYFAAVFVPLMVPVVLLMGAGPHARWRLARRQDFWPDLAVPGALAVVAGIGVPAMSSRWSPLAAMGVMLAAWAIGSSVGQVAMRAGGGAWRVRVTTMTASRWGMVVAHCGVGVFILGVTMVKSYETSAEVRMAVGDTTSVGAYTFKLAAIEDVRGPNYAAVRARIDVGHDGVALAPMAPEKRVYLVQRMPMTEAAIDPGITRDLYVSLAEQLPDGAWIVRIQHKPFVNWIWGGCLLMALGGLLAASDRRYRFRRTGVAGAVAVSA